ncbi:MAG: hypothetical protein H0V89_09005, partial [Deltaproteobacteria bacterium]|nr:hypothetical protein [Deltaproteobacteria bacterium]
MPHRYAGSEGEREMLAQVKARLPTGVVSRSEGFVGFTSPALVIGLHAAALLGSGLLGLFAPVSATLLCALILASLWAEGMGRFSFVRWVLPKQASYNLVVRQPADRPLGTVVIAVPLDIPRWQLDALTWPRRPLKFVIFAGVVLTAVLGLRISTMSWNTQLSGAYISALLVLAGSVGLGWMAHRRTGAAQDDASAPAVQIELIRRFRKAPVAGVDLWFAFTGCANAYQNGMHAFLAMRGTRLTSPILVLALDEPARAPLGAVTSEGPLLAQPHRPTGPALVERLRWAGLKIPSIDRPGVTDARAAMLWGYRALALSGGSGRPSPEQAAQAADVAEALVRLYAHDVARVPDFAPMMGELAVDRVPEGEVGEQRALGRLLQRLRARVARRPPEAEDDT